ncbi:hypothetical protein BN1708_009568 [Verticillium longisporum]|uniref:Uncharacterized protein n=1 Tax=Verticillium longisporum TaxID=100787 RepID=A0A0G4KIG6_VERLO|nr:hypothetical protein BN1708_009568 [Verticillium longisporum]
MAGTEHHAVQPFLQHQPHATRQASPPHDHDVDPLYRPSVSMAPPPRQPDSDTASLPEAEDVQLYEFKGLAARKASKVRVLARVLGKWIVTVVLIVAVYAVLVAYSVDRPVMSTTKKRQFNALITGLLITLGLSTASFLTGMCDDMRWWILSRRARSQHKVEHILHAHSTSRVIRLALRSKRSNIHVVVTLWVLLIIGAQVGIASIGLCYSVERTEDKALLVRGNVSIPDMSTIETTKVANGSNSQRAQEYTANRIELTDGQSLGSVSLAYDTSVIDQIPQPGDLYSSDDPLFFCDDGGCIYAFHEVNTKSALDPDSFPITAVTNRLVRVDTICRSYRVTSGGDGLFENITIADSNSGGGSRNVTLPVLGGGDQSTFFTDTMAPCGPTCGSVSVFEASSSSPWLYECNTTVGTPANASLPEHALGEDLVWMVAVAVALQGYSTTAADEDLQVQGIVYPAATYWGTPMSGSSDALELLMSRFAIGVLGMAAQSNTALFVWGDAPMIGQKLNMEHWDMIHLIMVLTAGLQLVLGTAAALTAHRVVVPEGGPVAEAEVLRPMLGGARKRRRGRFDKGKGSMSLAVGQGGDVKTAWVYRNTYVGDGVYDLYMEEVLVPCKSSESKTNWGSKKTGSRWDRLIKRNKENRASTDRSSSSRAGLRDG